MSETLTIDVELTDPEETTLDSLREEFGEGVEENLEVVAQNAVERRIHELWMNREQVQQANQQMTQG